MRDFRNAKAMAATLREALAARTITVSHSESLELVSRMLGASDWNTLSARIQADRPSPAATASGRTYPVVPIRDYVAFPGADAVLFVGRPRTMQALDHAFSQGRREVLLAVQKDPATEDPKGADLYVVGVLARLVDLLKIPPAEGRGPTLKILVHGQRRVSLRRFADEEGVLHAEIADIHEGQFPETPDLVDAAMQRFEGYAKARDLTPKEAWPGLTSASDPGRVADLIALRLQQPVAIKQDLLETLDPEDRLRKVLSLLEAEPTAA
jgi:ATP-dependent Lon protease